MLYICATPIGNLKDISLRALEILARSDIILCEDTRVSRHLLDFHQIKYNKLITLNEHNENTVAEQVIDYLTQNLEVVLISDAGTPGISDPGARLCNKVRDAGFIVSPIPGACAYTSLLSVSGLLDTPSLFHGFLPHQSNSRCKILAKWQDVDYAVCIYEAPHRIIACIEDMIKTIGSNREIIMGRELTKKFETIKKTTGEILLDFIKNDKNQQKGEFVLLILPQKTQGTTTDQLTQKQKEYLSLLIKELPPKKAVNLTHQLIGGNKDSLYKHAISINK